MTSASHPQLDRLVWITRQLRDHCPWTAQLTHEQLTTYMVEEAYEAVEAIESEDPSTAAGAEELRKELGDVLFQVVLHSAVAEDRLPDGGFTIEGVAEAISSKMIRRNPHVFTPDGELLPEEELDRATVEDVEKAWERIKQKEKQSEDVSEVAAEQVALDSIFHTPAGYPALSTAQTVISRARRHPATEENPAFTADDGTDETAEQVTVDLSDDNALGATLFAVAAAAHDRGLDAESALRRYVQKLKADLLG